MARKESPQKVKPEAPLIIRVLDAGMGFGQYSWWMAGQFPGWNITAADIKSEQVADCNAFFSGEGLDGRVHVIEADLVTWTGTVKYDLILCVDVMEHIEEDRKVFSSFAA